MNYICHVCGYSHLVEPPWGIDGRASSFNICPCCGLEFGYQDATPTAFKRYKDEWLAKGAKWFDEELKPSGWDLHNQLKNINYIPKSLLPLHLRDMDL